MFCECHSNPAAEALLAHALCSKGYTPEEAADLLNTTPEQVRKRLALRELLALA